jgi:hypothetical protein
MLKMKVCKALCKNDWCTTQFLQINMKPLQQQGRHAKQNKWTAVIKILFARGLEQGASLCVLQIQWDIYSAYLLCICFASK